VQGFDIETALDWRGRTVVDRHGEKVGTLREIYLDETERPSWGSIHTGLFGLRQTLAPLREARLDGDQLRVPYERDHVKDAPNVDPDVQLTPEEEQRLYRHYDLATAAGEEQTERTDQPGAISAGRATETGAAARPSSPDQSESGAAPQAPDDAMTRSEEEVRIGKRTRERGRARLKKYVVTDYVETKVPVKREEVRLEHEPPDEADRPG
jgi:stress response protein YsnF